MRMSFCMTFALAHHVIHTGPITGGNIMYIMLCVQPYCMCMQHFIGTVHSCKIMQIKLYQQVGAYLWPLCVHHSDELCMLSFSLKNTGGGKMSANQI